MLATQYMSTVMIPIKEKVRTVSVRVCVSVSVSLNWCVNTVCAQYRQQSTYKIMGLLAEFASSSSVPHQRGGISGKIVETCLRPGSRPGHRLPQSRQSLLRINSFCRGQPARTSLTSPLGALPRPWYWG